MGKDDGNLIQKAAVALATVPIAFGGSTPAEDAYQAQLDREREEYRLEAEYLEEDEKDVEVEKDEEDE